MQVLQGTVCPLEMKGKIHQSGNIYGWERTINADRNGSSQGTGRMLKYLWKIPCVGRHRVWPRFPGYS